MSDRGAFSQLACRRGLWLVAATAALVGSVSSAPAAPAALAATPRTTEFVDINPDNEGPLAGQPGLGIAPCPDPCASQHNGGRVNGVATVPGVPGSVPTTYFGASEVGGLFKSVNGAASWEHLDGHIPNLTWDVAARPDGLHVFATSFYDGRSVPLTGVQQSTDGGATWTHPNLPDPAGCAPSRAAQPSGFGLGLRPGTTEAFAGTNCGLARSLDDGSTWTRFDPTPDDGTANSVWDVVALPGGRTYACGDDGLLVSMSGAPETWQSLGKPDPTLGGYCSLAVSPDDPTVVFIASGFAYFADIVVSLGGADFFEGRLDESGAVPTIALDPVPLPRRPDGRERQEASDPVPRDQRSVGGLRPGRPERRLRPLGRRRFTLADPVSRRPDTAVHDRLDEMGRQLLGPSRRVTGRAR